MERDPHIGRISLVAFNMEQSRVVYRQEAAETNRFPGARKGAGNMKLGTVNVQQLGQKHGETDFLQSLIEKEVDTSHPDAVIFAGPKAMLDADVPEDDLRRIGDIECPVFYLNYNLNPQAVPWKDSISHAIRVFKGTEYTISRPRDLMVLHIRNGAPDPSLQAATRCRIGRARRFAVTVPAALERFGVFRKCFAVS